MTNKIEKTCKRGHVFYKSSSCPTCPICEKLKAPFIGFLGSLGSPARNALLSNNIDTLQKLSQFSEADILKMHGIGKSTIPKLKLALEAEGLCFSQTN